MPPIVNGMVRILVLLVAFLTACSPGAISPTAKPASTATGAPDRKPEQVFTWAGQERGYLVHVPKNFDESREYPLLLALHAAGSTAVQFERSSGFDALSDARGFIVVYGQGTSGGSRTNVWNAGGCCGTAAAKQLNVDDVGFAKEVVKRMQAAYRIDAKRVFVAGMSNGGMMAHRLGCEASDVFHGIAAVAGTIQVATCNPPQKLPVFMVHGTEDATVPYAGGASKTLPNLVLVPVEATFVDWARREGCVGNRTTASDKGVDILSFPHCDQPVQLIRINRGWHQWPRGTAQLITNFFRL